MNTQEQLRKAFEELQKRVRSSSGKICTSHHLIPVSRKNTAADLRRIINPSGQFNVRRRGTTWRDIHPYLFMINASWPVFAALIFGAFVIGNVVFALIYMKIGVEHLQGADTATLLDRFMSAFFFSAQTFTTVGYGRISPDGVLTSLVASLQALLGLMALAIGTGLLFGRFSRPAARLELQPADGGGALSIRHRASIPRSQPAQQQFNGSGGAVDGERPWNPRTRGCCENTSI